MKKTVVVLSTLAMMAASGCNNRNGGAFLGHQLGESFAQFAAIEHPRTQSPTGVPYTGIVHCFETRTIGDQCKGPRYEYDNAHFTFLDDKLAKIETVGAGGIEGVTKLADASILPGLYSHWRESDF